MKTLIQRKELDLEKVKAMQAALIAWYEKIIGSPVAEK